MEPYWVTNFYVFGDASENILDSFYTALHLPFLTVSNYYS